MKEETFDQLKKRFENLQRSYDVAAKERELERRAVDVLVAAGFLDRAKLEQAQQLVRDLGFEG